MKKLTLLIPYMFLYMLLFLIPLGIIIFYSVGNNNITFNYLSYVFNADYIRNVFINTIIYSISSTLITAILGWIAAYIIIYGRPKVSLLLSFAIIIPLVLNPLVIIYGWVQLLGNNGLVQELFQLVYPNENGYLLYTPVAVIIGIIYIGLPYMTISILTSMLEIKLNILSAARSMGSSLFQVISKIIFPLSRQGLYTGSFLVFILSIGYFLIPALLGGGKVIFASTLIEQNINIILNWSLASAISVWLLISVSIIVIFIKNFLFNKFYKMIG